MKYNVFILFVLVFGLSSCHKVEEESVEQKREKALLDFMLFEIIEISESDECEDNSRWSYVAYGSKSCGGPVGYIPYSLDIDVVNFKDRVKEHAEAERIFNIKWGIESDCTVPPEPVELICEDNKAVLRY